MKILRIEETQTSRITGIRCDRCKVDVRSSEDISGQFALQECLSIDFVAGYGAKAFDDGTRYTCDLCEYCIKTLLGPYLRSREPASECPI